MRRPGSKGKSQPGRIGGYRPDEAGRTVPGNRRLPGIVPRLSPFALGTACLAGGAVILAAIMSVTGLADESTRQWVKYAGVALAVVAVGWEGFNRVFAAPKPRRPSETDEGR